MYTREQASQLRQAFWTTYGQYMAPVLSAEGLRRNWLNYKTGLKNVEFKMQADSKRASIGIEITHKDTELQELFYEQFLQLRTLLHESLGEEWKWEMHTTDEYDKTISRIYKEIAPVNIFDKEDWPQLISFFKPRIIALDEFWNTAQYAFDELR
ncbi:DUF4268 domain-containing protein [Pontibacter vulgaris]|uniref:DUF4268 domain-containing protein n=1 Tax=Pontibacter vulgaris TaxID=2905679 RepID=UPI001FA6F928|nr:DUF4268 domain-containing protein [Pontibacter vulgaris]